MKPPTGMVIIYALVAEGEGPRYIGVTKCSLAKRLREHKHESKTGNTRKARWFRKRMKQGVKIAIVCIVAVPEQDWSAWERAYIKRARELGIDLVNTCEGGLGLLGLPENTLEKRGKFWLGRKHTEETKARISAAKKNPSAETRAKISAATLRQRQEGRAPASPWKGKKQPPEMIAKRVASMRGRKASAETRAKLSASVKAVWARRKAGVSAV